MCWWPKRPEGPRVPQLRCDRDVLVSRLGYCGKTRISTYPVVVVVGQVQLAKVDSAKSIGVANEVALPVVVEVVPRDGDPIAAANGVELAIVVVRTNLLRELGLEFIVIDPDASAVLDGHAIVVDDKTDGKVANDDIGRVDNRDTALTDLSVVADTQDGLVAAGAQTSRQIDAAFNVDDARCCASDSSNQTGGISDRDYLALVATSGFANGVVLRVTHKIEVAEMAR